MGTSKGADLALQMAYLIPEVKATVAINSFVGNAISDIKLRDGAVLPGYPLSLHGIVVSAKIE